MKLLSIELSDFGVKFTSVNEGHLSDSRQYEFQEKQEFKLKEQLDLFLTESGFKSLSFDDTVISWSSRKTTLIPANIFSESSPEAIFRICYGSEIPKSNIDYNRIPEQGLVNIFELPLWVKSFFVVKYPRSIIQHEGSHLLRGIFSEPGFKLKTHIIVYSDFFLLMIIKENKLQFYSTFDYTEKEDIVYNLIFSLQQKDLISETNNIQISNGLGSKTDQLIELKDKLSTFPDLKSSAIEINSNFILNSQKLCV